MTRSLVVVSAGLRQPSSTRLLADRLAQASDEQLQLRGEQSRVAHVELRDLGHDMVNQMITGYPSEALEEAQNQVTRADGLIAVTPTFTGSYNGLFKMFFDVLDNTALVDKPVLIAATGGTARHSLVLEHALRPLFSYLHAAVVPTTVFAAPEDWGNIEASGASLMRRVERAAVEMAREVQRREAPIVADPYQDVNFDRLLNAD
ncbi:FMN reductase [Streptomyces misionensis]|uniref:FMN reductase n=1 Tax=Streptomyces misionensis TaxID=67331 RepID=A0A1H4R024_9ACTN|nr:FMN reductase [Streptomyces misionensis]SEC25158.1 FMN reductase [Streptomyces misionensis]